MNSWHIMVFAHTHASFECNLKEYNINCANAFDGYREYGKNATNKRRTWIISLDSRGTTPFKSFTVEAIPISVRKPLQSSTGKKEDKIIVIALYL